MKNKHLFVDFEIQLIQQLRLIQSITESAYSISIPKEQEYKFENSPKDFSFMFIEESRKNSKSLSEIITVNHKTPLTCIAKLCRPLIFPHKICSHCRTLWKDSREIKFSFIGLLTRERKNILEKWRMEQNDEKRLNSILSTFHTLREIIKLKMGKMSHRKFGELHVFSSRKGREYPTKAWDKNYYELLAQSQFVLCPRGKSDWTYRFFEAILCGAIPVVEKDCDVFHGFKFHKMDEPNEKLTWTREIAEFNYQLCLERITIPLPVLNKTLQTLLEK